MRLIHLHSPIIIVNIYHIYCSKISYKSVLSWRDVIQQKISRVFIMWFFVKGYKADPQCYLLHHHSHRSSLKHLLWKCVKIESFPCRSMCIGWDQRIWVQNIFFFHSSYNDSLPVKNIRAHSCYPWRNILLHIILSIIT